MPKPRASGSNLGSPSRSGRSQSVAIEALENRVLMSRTWAVATSGNDFNAGTLAAPFRTIQHAASLAATGDTVLIEGGTYRETVRPANSGVIFQNYNGQNVTVSGADVVGGFSNYSGSVYRTSMPWDLGEGNNQIFVNGQMINEARWPNASLDLSHPTLAHVTGYSSGTIYDSALTQPSGYWNGALIHITPGQQWVAYTGTVTSSGPGWRHVSLPPLGSWEQPTAGNSYYLTGKFQALDAPGEWYRDPTSGQLYVWTPRSDDPSGDLIEAKHRQFAFDLSGRWGIQINGINVFAATIKTDWGSSGLVLNQINAAYLSQFTQLYNGWAAPGASGIMLNGANSVLENSTIAYSAGDGVYVGASGVRVINSVIHDVDYSASDAAGIRVVVSGATIDHNTIYNAGRSGITHRIPRTTITYNLIHDVMLQTTDGAGIYTQGTNGGGAVIAYNSVYNVTAGGFGGVGIFLDDNSSNFVIHDNTTWNVNTALKLNSTSYFENIYNNRLGAITWSVGRNGTNYYWAGTVLRYNTFYHPVLLGTGVSVVGNVTTSGSPIPVAPAGASGSSVPSSPPPPTPTLTSTSYSARNSWQASQYFAAHGVQTFGTAIGSADNGDWVEYKGLDFGSGVSTFQASLAVPASYAGQSIVLRLDSPTGQIIGTLVTSSTGSWSTYLTESTAVSGVSGAHNLYITFVGTTGVANLQWWRFA